MAKRGRKPKPAELREAEGNRGNRPIPDAVKPPKPSIVPTPPVWLSTGAKSEWRRVAKELYNLGLLTRLDRAIFAAYCQAYADWQEAEKSLQALRRRCVESGNPEESVYISETTNGNKIQNPLIGVINTARKDMLRFATELGLSPVARTQVASRDPKTPPPKDSKGAGRFFN